MEIILVARILAIRTIIKIMSKTSKNNDKSIIIKKKNHNNKNSISNKDNNTTIKIMITLIMKINT